MGDYGIILNKITSPKDDRKLLVRMRVPWIFDTNIGKAYLIITSFISVYTVGKLVYSLFVRFA